MSDWKQGLAYLIVGILMSTFFAWLATAFITSWIGLVFAFISGCIAMELYIMIKVSYKAMKAENKRGF